jgi:hypothetical protein
VLTPSCWHQNNPYSPALDRLLNDFLDARLPFEPISPYEVKLGGWTWWIANHPFASFGIDGMRPRRATILRAGAALAAQCGSDRFVYGKLRKTKSDSGVKERVS